MSCQLLIQISKQFNGDEITSKININSECGIWNDVWIWDLGFCFGQSSAGFLIWKQSYKQRNNHIIHEPTHQFPTNWFRKLFQFQTDRYARLISITFWIFYQLEGNLDWVLFDLFGWRRLVISVCEKQLDGDAWWF
jgi:hypothetical protein